MGSSTIVVDARRLGEGSAARGIGTYLRNLLAALPGVDGIEVRALATDRTALPAGVDRVPLRRWAAGRLLTVEHEVRLPSDLGRSGADVAHSPAVDPPRRSPMPWVQTVHDLIPLVYDEREFAIERRRWRRYGPRVKKAAAVVTPSRHSAKHAVDALDLDPDRVHVIPHGVEPHFHPAGGAAEGRDGSGRPYVLYVGAWGPHKGYAEAMEAAAGLADAGRVHGLVIAGPQDAWLRAQIQRVVDAARRPDLVEVVGFVDDLASLYRGATALLVTSRHEGFGLPALEAMACGTPVVAFANSAIPEVIGDGGTLVPDGDVAQLVRATRALIDNDELRRAQSMRGVRRASQFSWRRSAEAHADVYRAAQSSSVR